MASYDFTTLARENCADLAPGLSDCYAQLRGTVRSPDYWRWRYLDGPDGPSCLVVASYEGRVVGMLGTVYVACSVRGERRSSALLGDLNVDPEHRRWACYAGLLRTSAESPAHRDVPFAFAFVTRGFAAWAPRFGCVDLGPVPAFTGVFGADHLLEGLGVPTAVARLGRLAAPLCLRTQRSRGSRGLEVRPLDGAGELADGPAAGGWGAGAVLAQRDAAYLTWRYDACPDADYTVLAASEAGVPVGVAVFRVDESRRRAYLAELCASPDRADVLDVLLDAVLTRMADGGAGVVTASFPVGSGQGRALSARRFGLWATPLWGMRLATFPYSVGSGHPSLRRSDWFFSLGDWLTH